MKWGFTLLAVFQNLTGQVLTEIDQVGIAGFQHARSVSDIKILSDGKHVLSSSRDNRVRLWEITSGKEVRSFTNHNIDDVWGLCLLPGEKEFLCAVDFGKGGAILRFDIATGKELGIYEHSKTAFRIDVHPDGKRFAAGDNANIIKLWDLKTGKTIREYSGHSGSVYSVVFNGDGSRLFSGCDEGELKMWDTETGKCLKTHTTEFKEIYTISASPDHKRIAVVAEDQFLHLFESKGLKKIWNKKLGDEAQVVTWSPDGELVAAAGHDSILYIFNSRNGKILQRIPTERDHTPVAFTTDGKLLISGGDNHLHLHNVDTGERFHPTLGVPALTGGFEGVAVTNDGLSVYAHGGGDQLVRWTRGEKELTDKIEVPHTITDLAISKDGSTLALSDNAGGISIFSSDSGKLSKRIRTGAPITKMTFNLDPNELIVGGQQGSLALWKVDQEKKTGGFSGLSKELLDLEISPDGRTLVSAERDGRAVFWNIGTRRRASTHRAYYKDENGQIQSNHPQTLTLINNGRSLLAGIQGRHLLTHLKGEKPKSVKIENGRVEQLVAQLADPSFKKRGEATKELESMGAPILTILENLTNHDPEVNARIRGIIRSLTGDSKEGDFKLGHAFNGTIYSLAGDPKGRYFAATIGWSANAILVVGEIVEGKVKIRQTLKSGRSPKLVTFSPNGKFLIAGNRNGMVDVYSVGR